MLQNQILCVLWYATLTRNAILLNLVCDKYTFAKDVVSHNLGTYDACNHLARVNSDSEVQLLGALVRWLLPNFFHDVHHFKSCLDHTLGLINHHLAIPSLLVDSAIVAHYHVFVANRVYFVDFVFLAELIKPREQFLKEYNHFSGVANVLVKGCDSYQVSIQQSQITVELIYLSFLRLDNTQHVVWHQLADEVVCFADFYV